MNPADLPVAITAADTVLADWTHREPAPLSKVHDHVWTKDTDTVTLATWVTGTRDHTTLTYERGGAELAYLALSSPGQVRAFLSLLGIGATTEPTVREVAEAMVVAS